MTTAFDYLFDNYPASYRPQRNSPVPHEGFSGAVVYRVETPAGQFALRCWPHDAPPAAQLIGLHRLLAWTHARGVAQLAVPVRTTAGHTLCDYAGRLCQLEPWMPGIANFHAHPSDVKLATVMRTLAEFHLTTAAYRVPWEDAVWFAVSPSAPSPAVQGRLRRLTTWQREIGRLQHLLAIAAPSEFRELGREMLAHFARLSPEIAAQLLCASRIPVPLLPCLRDVWHDHILWTGNAVTGLIDPSACQSDCVATDLSRLLGSLLGDDRERWDFALAEYSRHRALSLEEIGLVPVLDRSGTLLSGMTWLERQFLCSGLLAPRAEIGSRSEQSTADQATKLNLNHSRVVVRLRTICKRLRQFA